MERHDPERLRRPILVILALVTAALLVLAALMHALSSDPHIDPPAIDPTSTTGSRGPSTVARQASGHLIDAQVDRHIPDDVPQGSEEASCEVQLTAIRVDSHPLQGVRFGLRRWPGEDTHTHGVTDQDGHCVVSCSPGQYLVEAVHDHYGLLEASHLPQRVIVVPGSGVRTTWIPAYVSGLLLTGAETFAGIDMIRFDPLELKYVSVEPESGRHVAGLLARRDMPGWTSIVYCANAPAFRSLTLFDRLRGPCKVQVPLVFAADYDGPISVDLASMPVVEPMGELEILLEDCDGVPIADAEVSLISKTKYAGVYSGGTVPANAVTFVPPGEYVVRYTSPIRGEAWTEKAVVVTSGARQKLKWRSDYALFDVVIKVGRKGILSIGRGEVFGLGGQPKHVTPGQDVRICLPTGKFSCELVRPSGSAAGLERLTDFIEVSPRREPQVQQVFGL